MHALSREVAAARRRRCSTRSTSATCSTSSSRTSSATWRPTSTGAAIDLGRMRVAIAFADLAGYTRLTEEEGELTAVDAVERFVEAVEVTLPDEARVIKTIGDEAMIVGSDPAALTDWAVGFQTPADRAAAAADRGPLRRGAVPRRRLLRPRREHRLAGGGPFRRRRGARHPPGRRATPAPHLRVRADRRGAAEGLHRVDRVFIARQRARSDVSRRPSVEQTVRERAACWRAGPAGRRPVLRRAGLDLPARPRGRGSPGAARSRALHVNYGLRDGADADERHCAATVRAARGRARRSRRPRAGPSDAATCRRGRARSATRAAARAGARRASADVAAGHTATDQVETILYRLASSPSRRALLGMRRARRAVADRGRCSRSRARRPPRTAASAA